MAKSSKEKEKPLDKIKSFLGIGKVIPSPALGLTVPKIEELSLTPEILKEISPESQLSHRLKCLKDLADIVKTKRLQENASEVLYTKTCDLLHPSHSAEARHTVLWFYCYLVLGQCERLETTRTHFFTLVLDHNIPEDLPLRLELFKVLTENGKCIKNFEEAAPPFLLKWMPDVISAGKATDLLGLLINIIKFNSAFIDKNVVTGFVQHTCILCCRTNSEEDVKLSLEVLEAVVAYSILPPQILPHVIPTLCRTVVIEKFTEMSWKLMRNLVGTHLGHSAISSLCYILEDSQNHNDHELLKGAVFYLAGSLWGPNAVSALKHTPSAVLPSISKALDCKDRHVAYEVVVALHRLVTKSSHQFHSLAWNLVLDVLDKLVDHPEIQQIPASAKPQTLFSKVHDLLTLLEQWHEEGRYGGSADRLFDIIEKCSQNRPEASIHRLIQFRAQAVQFSFKSWISNLSQLMDRYFRRETRRVSREKALNLLSFVLSTNRHVYEEELLDNIVLPYLNSLDTDTDPVIVTKGVQLLTDFAQDSSSKRCREIFDIIERIFKKPFEGSYSGSATTSYTRSADEVFAIQMAAQGLTDVFKCKLLSNSHYAIRAYQLLTNHILLHYQVSAPPEDLATVRIVIFRFLLSIRTNSLQQLGIVLEEDSVKYSPYLLCSVRESVTEKPCFGATSPLVLSPLPSSTSSSSSLSYLCLDKAFRSIVLCLKQEKDWPVLVTVLQGLPELLKNKSVMLCGQTSISSLCSSLCALVKESNKGYLEQLRQVPPKVTLSELHSLVFPILATLTVYKKELEPYMVRMLIRSLESGLASKSTRTCIRALMLSTLEMKDAMYKVLPEVLLKLSKVSATVAISVPVLEFLSNLIRLPQLYASFVEEQYRSIFAIALPYTNPFKFNHFIVALAHHVIALWFLKCRITFRKDFVPFVIKGLKSNLMLQHEDGPALDDVVQRKRSSSLNDQTSARRHEPRHSIASLTPGTSSSDVRCPPDSDTVSLQVELMETCVDLMAQYSFGLCSSVPKRTPAADFILKNGQALTWMMGNKLITITTSGCGTKAYRLGLCEKCYRLCRDASDDDPMDDFLSDLVEQPKSEMPLSRRRHRSDIQTGTTSLSHVDVPSLVPCTKDDLILNHSFKEGLQRSKSKPNSPVSPLLYCNPEKQESLKPLLGKLKSEQANSEGYLMSHVCNCMCRGWAEVMVRRPTGNSSWIMRIQNNMFSKTCPTDFPLPDITAIFKQFRNVTDSLSEYQAEEEGVIPHSADQPSTTEITETKLETPSNIPREARETSLPSQPTESSKVAKRPEDLQLSPQDQQTSESPKHRSSSPLRRTNSSPEMPSDKSPIAEGVLAKSPGILSNANRTPRQSSNLAVAFAVGPPPPSPSRSVEEDEPKRLEARQESTRSSLRKSPRKEDRYESIPEEPKTVPGGGRALRSKARLKLDLSNVQGASQDVRDPSPGQPLSAGPPSPLSPLAQKVSQETDVSALPPASSFRDRGHTISVMSPVKPPTSPVGGAGSPTSRAPVTYRDMYRCGMNPSFVFLHLYHNSCFGTDHPIMLPETQARAIKVLDHIPPYETHKIGVVYVGEGQANSEAAILSNPYGSKRYVNFLLGLGSVISLKNVNPQVIYIGGLESEGQDGNFAVSWQDDVMQVIFHVATLMPNKDSDPSCTKKKRHIGNDFVTIVYNQSNEDYTISTIKGQCTYACVVIHPLDFGSNMVILKGRTELLDLFGHSEPHIVSDDSLALYVRQLALHANLASTILQKQNSSSKDPYVNNWLERLRHIKRIRSRLGQKSGTGSQSGSETAPTTQESLLRNLEDFTDYV